MHRNPKSAPQQSAHQDGHRAQRQLTVCRFQTQGTIRGLETLEDMLIFFYGIGVGVAAHVLVFTILKGVRLSLE